MNKPGIISCAEVQLLLQQGDQVTLLEALPEKYYLDGHLPGALRIDYDRVRDQAETLLPDKEAAIVVYCASSSCQNSGIAAKSLVAMGYSRVSVFEAGKEAWSQAGLPLEKGEVAA